MSGLRVGTTAARFGRCGLPWYWVGWLSC